MRARDRHSRLAAVMLAFAVLVLSAPVSGESKPKQDTSEQKPKPPVERIDRLIEQLGADRYAAREDAMMTLYDVGLVAVDRVRRTHEQTEDAEIEWRCERLLEWYRDLSVTKQLAALERGELDAADVDLPGWQRLRRRMPDSKGLRQCYADMLRAERKLLETADRTPARAGQILYERAKQMQRDIAMQGSVSAGTLTAVLFLAAETDVNVQDRAGNYVSAALRYLGSTRINKKTRDSFESKVRKQLLVDYLTRDNAPNTLYTRMSLALTLGMEQEARALALSAINQKGLAPSIRGRAVMALGAIGGKKDIALLEPMLDDKTVVMRRSVNRKKYNIHLGDVALAGLLRLTNQRAEDYGLHSSVTRSTSFSYHSVYFQSEKARADAIKKWRAYRAEMLKKEKAQEEKEGRANEAEEKKPAD